jgi:hypothetical protein
MHATELTGWPRAAAAAAAAEVAGAEAEAAEYVFFGPISDAGTEELKETVAAAGLAALVCKAAGEEVEEGGTKRGAAPLGCWGRWEGEGAAAHA